MPGTVTAVIQRDDLLFQDVEQFFSLFEIAVGRIVLRAVRSDGPAVLTVVAFAPPAVEYREIDYAIDRGLLARCTACFHRVLGCIEPHVDAGDEFARDRQIVALEYDDM